jgi:hypothetical protein
VIRLRYIRFSLFCPFVSGTVKRVGVAPKTRSCFSGHTERAEKEKPLFRLSITNRDAW